MFLRKSYQSCFLPPETAILSKMKVALIFLAVCSAAYAASLTQEAQNQLQNVLPTLDAETGNFLQQLLNNPEAVAYLQNDQGLQQKLQQALGVAKLFDRDVSGDRTLLLYSWLYILSRLSSTSTSG